LDFHSIESVEQNLKFDLSFYDSEILNMTTWDFENVTFNEVVDNSVKEDEFNEHKFFRLFDDKFEGKVEMTSSRDECERKLGL